MLYFLLDDFLGNEELSKLKQALGDKSLQDLNITVLDGARMSRDDLIRACDAAPFLAEKRLVIVRRLLSRVDKAAAGLAAAGPAAAGLRKSGRAELARAIADYLPQLPSTTDVVFVDESLPAASNPILKAIQSNGGRVAQHRPYNDEALADWIQKRARLKGGRIGRGAAARLASFVGNNLWLLDSEIEKLVVYAGEAEIGERDVQAMVSYAREANIFSLMDAIGQRDGRTALRKLRELLDDGAAPPYLLTMITRQIRLMLLVKELAGVGQSPDAIGTELKLHRFPRDKILQQIRRFSLTQLEQAYQKLLALDVGIKTGKITPLVGLDLLVLELAGGG